MRTFANGGLTMAYHTFGRGPVPIVAFHGFGRSGQDFAILEPFIGERCTIHAFDLPFHGNSPSPTERVQRPITPEEFAAFFTAFADQCGWPRFTLMGYSLGGRMALSLVERTPQRIAKTFLIAPDGLKHRPWYRGLAGSRIGRGIYAHFIDHPGLIQGLINGLRTVRLMGDRMHRFLIGQTDTREKRMLLRDIWLSLRVIEPELAVVAANAQANDIPLQLVFGERDKVIRSTFGGNLRALAPMNVQVKLIPTGHVVLIPELGEWLRGEALT